VKPVLATVDALIRPIIAEEDCELIDVELTSEEGRRILRVYIDKPGGVLLGDCSRVSHAIEDVLEVEGAVPGRYDLEVSSPGLNRPLRSREHFEKAIGKTVKVEVADMLEGRRRFKGLLKAVVGDEAKANLTITIDAQDFIVPLSLVQKASLVCEF
jgi:ribosome maturation factor RimP